MISERSARRETRNPLLALPAFGRLQALPIETRREMAAALRELKRDAASRAAKAWQTHKAPMAVYWKAVSVYCGHIARVLDAKESS